MESGHKGGGGTHGEGEEGHSGGHQCHVCGYQYPNPHPSAKQRRAHRKNCGKPPSAAATAVEEGSEERSSKKLLLGEGGRGGGEGNGSSAADCGRGLPGSAQEVGNVAEDDDNAEHSSPNGTGAQVIINECTEDCLVSCNNIPSEIPPKAFGTYNDEIQTEVSKFSEKAVLLEDGHPFEPAVSSDQHQDASTSLLPPESGDGARFSSEFSTDEMKNSNCMLLPFSATAGEISAQTNAIVRWQNDLVTEVGGLINTVGKDKPSEDMSVKGSEFELSCQEKLQTTIVKGHSATPVEEDSSVKNLTGVSKEEIPNEETESMVQSELIYPNSKEQVSTIEEPATLLVDQESRTEKPVCADNTNGDDLFELTTGSCQLEAPDIVEPQQQIDSTFVTADQLTISKQASILEEQHCPSADGSIPPVSSTAGPALGAEVMSVGSAADLTKNVCSSDATMGDNIPENLRHTGGITFMPSQVYLMELNTDSTSHEIGMVGSKGDVEEKKQNEKITADVASHKVNEVRSIDNIEEKQHNEGTTAYSTPHEINAVCDTGNAGERKQNEGTTADASFHKVNAVQNTDGVEEKERNKEVNADPASHEINVISSTDIVEEKQSEDVYAGTTSHEINAVCSIENVEEKKQSKKITADSTSCITNMANITDNVEEKTQNEEITKTYTSHGISNVTCSADNEEKQQNEDITEGMSSHEIIVVHRTDGVEEKKNEETTSCPSPYRINVVTTTESIEESKQNEEVAADSNSHEINVVGATDNVEEENKEETASDSTPCKIDVVSSTYDVEEKKQRADPSSHETSMLQITDNVEEKEQNEEVAADSTSDEINVPRSTHTVEEMKQNEDTAAKEINTIQCTTDLKGNDQNEEITDKELILDSDKNHVSLKVLLAEKGVETKEKKTSTKDHRVLSFRRRASKDHVSSVKSGSPKAGSGQQDWNSPARLPIEKRPKGGKQQWVPFICCPSIN